MAIDLKPSERTRLTLTLRSTTPMIQHKWSTKAVDMMRDKHAGISTKNRDKRDPEQEFLAATYFMPGTGYGFKAEALSACMIGAAHVDQGIPKTLISQPITTELVQERVDLSSLVRAA